MDLFSVQVSGPFFPGIKTLVTVYLVYNTQDDLFIEHERYAYSEAGYLVYEVGGAVKRIDDPVIPRFILNARTFFCNEAGSGEQKRKPGDQLFLGGLIHISDQVMQALCFNTPGIQFSAFGTDECARFFYKRNGVFTKQRQVGFQGQEMG